jgi:tetratricopeptide (TPR) repeat protein
VSRKKRRKKHRGNELQGKDEHSDNRYAVWAAAILAPTVILLHLAVSYRYSHWTWGINHLRSFSPPVIVVTALVSLFLCVPLVAQKVWHGLGWTASSLTTMRPPWRYTLLSLGALIPFWLLRSRTHFLGDGYLRIRSVMEGVPVSKIRLLDAFVNSAAYRLLGRTFHGDGALVAAVLSCMAGAVFVYLTLVVAELVVPKGRGKPLLLALLWSAGAIQLFFGYVEVYPLATMASMVYIVVSILFLQGRGSLVFPTVTLGMAILLHQSALAFIPSLVYLWMLSSRSTFRRADLPPRAHIPPLVLLGMIVLVGLVVGLIPFPDGTEPVSPWGRLVSWTHANVIPLASERDIGLLSWEHLANVVNEQLLIGPVGFALLLLTLPLVRKTWSKGHGSYQFLIIASLGYLALTIGFKPNLGASRDWDLFAFGGFLFIITATWSLYRSAVSHTAVRYATVALAAVSLFHTIPWVVLNASEERSLARFQQITSANPLWSDFAKGYAHDELARYWHQAKGDLELAEMEIKSALEYTENARYYWRLGEIYSDQGRYQEALESLTRSVEIDPMNARSYNNLGLVYEKLGNGDKALDAYQQALRLEPNLLATRNNLGGLLGKLGRYQEAIEELRRAIAIDPNSAPAHYNLGTILHKTGDYQGALDHLETATRLAPSVAASFYQRGLVHRDLGKLHESIVDLKQAVHADPDLLVAWELLATTSAECGMEDEAREFGRMASQVRRRLAEKNYRQYLLAAQQDQIEVGLAELEQAVRRDPHWLTARCNLGVTYGWLGRTDEAITQLQIALRLDSTCVEAHVNLGTFLYQKGRVQEAIAELERALELDPQCVEARQNLEAIREMGNGR